MPRTDIQIQPQDLARGATILDGAPSPVVLTRADALRAVVTLQLEAKIAANAARTGQIIDPSQILTGGPIVVGDTKTATANMAPADVAILASNFAVRSMYNDARQVKGIPYDPPVPGGSESMSFAFTYPMALALVGVTGTVGATWWGIDKNTKQLELEKFQISQHVHQYLKNIEARVAAGQPLPAPPQPVMQAAAMEAGWTTTQLIAAVVGGLAVGAAAMLTRDRQRSRPRAALYSPNPPPSPRRRRRMAAPKKRTSSASSTKKKATRSRNKKNPPALTEAQSKKRIEDLRAQGYDVETETLSDGTVVVVKSKKKKPKRSASNRSRKKKATRKKANPKRKSSPKRGTKAAFMAAQKKKGASPKQAAARWAFAQRAKKKSTKTRTKRNPKARPRKGRAAGNSTAKRSRTRATAKRKPARKGRRRSPKSARTSSARASRSPKTRRGAAKKRAKKRAK